MYKDANVHVHMHIHASRHIYATCERRPNESRDKEEIVNKFLQELQRVETEDQTEGNSGMFPVILHQPIVRVLFCVWVCGWRRLIM